MGQLCRIEPEGQTLSRIGKIIGVAVLVLVIASTGYAQQDWDPEQVQAAYAQVDKTNESDLRIFIETFSGTFEAKLAEGRLNELTKQQNGETQPPAELPSATSPEPPDFAKEIQDAFGDGSTPEPVLPPATGPTDAVAPTDPAPPLVTSPTTPPAATSTPGSVAGSWFVILGSFPHAAVAEAHARVNWLASYGIDAIVVDTNNYPNLTNGLFAIVIEAQDKGEASRLLANVKGTVDDAYIKSAY